MSLTWQLVVMAKLPRLGRVKTRLARDIRDVPAWAFYRRTMRALIRRLSVDPRWQIVLAVSPDEAVHTVGIWPAGIPRIAQGPGDLGQRMGRLMRDLPPGPVVIIGSDIPEVELHHIERAFQALGRADAVFGPARDGGYWLVGLKRRPHVPEIFTHVRWSSPQALADTVSHLNGFKVEWLDTLDDIDTGEDYRRWQNRIARHTRRAHIPKRKIIPPKPRRRTVRSLDTWIKSGMVP